MSEHQRPSLEEQIAEKFKSVTTDALIRRMERAADFGYDDESFELNRRLKLEGKTWKWDGDRVEVYDLPRTDDERIKDAIKEAGEEGIVDDTTARMIASRYHDGQRSALYSFQSTGRIDLGGLGAELDRNVTEFIEDDDALSEIYALYHYVADIGERDAVEGWHETTRWGSE